MTWEVSRNHATGEKHLVRACRNCGADIVLVKSSRSGRYFPADVITWTAGDDFTKYAAVQPWRGAHQCYEAHTEGVIGGWVPTVDDYTTLIASVEAIEDEYGIDSEQARVADGAARELWQLVKAAS
jgi:hypothetical protein